MSHSYRRRRDAVGVAVVGRLVAAVVLAVHVGALGCQSSTAAIDAPPPGGGAAVVAAGSGGSGDGGSGAIALAPVTATAVAGQSSRFALFVGVGKYAAPSLNLPCVDVAIDQLTEAATKAFAIPNDAQHIHVLRDGNVNAGTLKSRIESIAEMLATSPAAAEEKMVVVYWIGHGITVPAGRQRGALPSPLAAIISRRGPPSRSAERRPLTSSSSTPPPSPPPPQPKAAKRLPSLFNLGS